MSNVGKILVMNPKVSFTLTEYIFLTGSLLHNIAVQELQKVGQLVPIVLANLIIHRDAKYMQYCYLLISSKYFLMDQYINDVTQGKSANKYPRCLESVKINPLCKTL